MDEWKGERKMKGDLQLLPPPQPLWPIYRTNNDFSPRKNGGFNGVCQRVEEHRVYAIKQSDAWNGADHQFEDDFILILIAQIHVESR